MLERGIAMNKLSLLNCINRVGAFSEKHTPELLTGVGITGVITTIALTVMATIKSVRLLDDEKERRIRDNPQGDNVVRLTPKEAAAIIWKPCLLPLITGTASAACLIASNAVNSKRSAALTAAYAITETAFRDYRGKVVDIVGNKKEDEIHTAIIQDKIEKNPVSKTEVIFTGDGTMLCYDAFAGRYFQSDRNKIEKAVNEVNRIILDDGEATLNEFYDYIGLEHTEIGEVLMWEAVCGDLIAPRFSSHLSSDGQPCLAISFNRPPEYGR